MANETIDVKKSIEEYMYQTDWRVKANANQSYSVGGMILNVIGKVVANYWLNEVYPKEAANAHRNGDVHIHDLDFLGGYCCGHSLRALLQEGFAGVAGKTSATPPKHFSAALGQMANFLGTMQNEWAGAQAFSSFDTFLAPFVAYDKLDYTQVKQEIQEFIYCCGTSSRWGGQTVFSNITLDIKVPEDLRDKPVLIGGIDTGTTYKDYQAEMDLINLALLDVMSAGDKDGRPFTFPIPTYNVTNDWDWDSPVANKIFEVTAKYGYPYFSNYISSDMEPSQVRSMCPLTGDTKVLVRSSKGVSIQDIYQIVNNMKEGRICEYQVWDGSKWCNAVPNKQVADKTVIVTMANGDVIKMGKDHLQFVPELDKSIPAKELEEGMYLPYNSSSCADISDLGQYEAGVVIGAFAGDGSFDDRCVHYSLSAASKDDETFNYIKKFFNNLGYPVKQTIKGSLRDVYVGAGSADYIKDFIQGDALTKRFSRKTFNMSTDFLRGVFDGARAYHRLYTSSHQLATDLCTIAAMLGLKHSQVYVDNNYRVDLPARDDLFKKIGDWNCYSIKSIEEGPVESLYCFDVDNESALFMLANGLMTHNCRLRLDLRELLKKGNGLFGSAEQTGSIGVVTLNMARIGYLYKDGYPSNYNQLKQHIRTLCEIAKEALEVKRKFLTDRLEAGFYPFTKRWLGTYRNFFSTIGVNGMNEMIRNYTNDVDDITTPNGKDMAEDLLNYIRDLMVEFQKETGHLYNLEATPAEGATTRFAREDKKRYPNIIQAGTEDAPFYTNSSQLPVDFTDDPFEALDLQDSLQTKYTGGTVLHIYLNQRMSSGEICKQFVKKVLTNYNLPYISITPVFSVCPKHGYIAGEHKFCPICEHELEAKRLLKENCKC
jgi:ribonucleoside-triphosphate reductase|nr:MAG TPA: anaerobic ribonucleoside triphosphate reductase [Caudoviricetes sp.]